MKVLYCTVLNASFNVEQRHRASHTSFMILADTAHVTTYVGNKSYSLMMNSGHHMSCYIVDVAVENIIILGTKCWNE